MRALTSIIAFALLSSCSTLRSPSSEKKPEQSSINIDPQTPKWRIESQLSQYSNSQILERIQKVEQVCITYNSIEEQQKLSRYVRARQLHFESALRERLNKKGFSSPDLKDLKKKGQAVVIQKGDWKESQAWLDQVSHGQPSLERCELMELALATGLARLQVLEPNKPICNFRDIMCKNKNEKAFREDTQRANFELRYFKKQYIPLFLGSYSRPEGPCDEEKIVKTAEKRLSFLNNSILPRRPLGYAVGMCGRSMTAHVIDDDITNNELPMPAGWEANLSDTKNEDEILDKILKIEEGR